MLFLGFISRSHLLHAGLVLATFLLIPVAFTAEPPSTPMLRIEAGMHTAAIKDLSVHLPTGRILTVSDDKTARVWDLQTGARLNVLRPPIDFGHEGKLYHGEFSSDGVFAFVVGFTGDTWSEDIFLYKFNTVTGHMVQNIRLPEAVSCLHMTHDGRWLVVGQSSGNCLIVDPSSGALTGEQIKTNGTPVAITSHLSKKLLSESPTLAIASLNGWVQTFSLNARGKISSLNSSVFNELSPLSSLRFDDSGDRLALSSSSIQGRAWILDFPSLKKTGEFDRQGIVGSLSYIEWTNGGQSLWAGGSWMETQPKTYLRKVSKQPSLDVLVAPNAITSLKAWGSNIVYSSRDPTWGVVNEDGLITRQATAPNMLFWKNASNLILSKDLREVSFGFQVEDGNQAMRFNLPDRRLEKDNSKLKISYPENTKVRVKGITLFIDDVAVSLKPPEYSLRGDDPVYSADEASVGDGIAVGAGSSCYKLGEDNNIVWTFPAEDSVYCVRFSNDGRFVVAAFGDGTIKWLDSITGRLILTLFVHADQKRWVLWTPEGYYDCSADGESLIGWHVNRGKEQAADFYPASKFRDTFYRPDIIDELIRTWDMEAAVKTANARRGKAPTAQQPKLEEVIARMAPPEIELTLGGPTRTLELPEAATEAVLTYRVRGGGSPVSQMRVLIDSRPIDTTAPVPADEGTEARVTVPLPPRDCVVALLAGNVHAFSEPAILNIRRQVAPMAPRPTNPAHPKKGVLYILAIGVSELKNQADLANLEKLEYADDDARAFHQALAGQTRLYTRIVPRVLTDDQATAGDILDALDWLKLTTQPEDTSLILMAGHGESDNTGRYTFCAHDYDRARRLRTGVGFEDIKLALGATKGEVVLFLDACSAGNSLGEGSRVNVTGLVNQLSDSDSNIVVFASSDGRTPSLESDDLQQGLFTHCVKEGLMGKADLLKNGRISLSALQTYVDDQVRELSEGQQIPVINIPRMVPNMTIGLGPEE